MEAARAEAERQRALADAEVEAGKKADAKAAARKAEELEAQRRSELSELKTLQAENGPLVDQTVCCSPPHVLAVRMAICLVLSPGCGIDFVERQMSRHSCRWADGVDGVCRT